MRPRALIFDDDPLIRKMLWTVFDQRGYEILTFPDPGLCPLHLRSECRCGTGTACTDVIVSDLQMPCLKGLDFVEELRGKGCHCRHIALMSGSWSESDIARAGALSCKLFIKPFRVSEVAAWLTQVEASFDPARYLAPWPATGSTAG